MRIFLRVNAVKFQFLKPLIFEALPITQAKYHFPSLQRILFSQIDFSNGYSFPWRFKILGFHCVLVIKQNMQ